jgi:hypothetical protein
MEAKNPSEGVAPKGRPMLDVQMVGARIDSADGAIVVLVKVSSSDGRLQDKHIECRSIPFLPGRKKPEA